MASGKSSEYQLAIKIAGKIQSSFNSAMGAAQKSLSALGDAAAKAAKIGALAMGAAATAAVAFGKASVDTGMEFDKAVSQIGATMGKSVSEISELRQKALEMGSATSFSATQAAEGLNVLAMAGLDANEQIAAIPRVLDLAAAGNLTLEQSASYAAGAVKGFSDSMENMGYYTDLMAKGATLANTDVAGLGEALSRSAATAKGYGQTADSVTLSLLRLADQNVTGEAASTALNRAMADLYTPTAAAQKALKALGVSAYDSTGKSRDFNEVVADLKESLSGYSEEQANAYAKAIFTSQGLSAFIKMTAASTETVDKFTKGLKEAGGSAAQQAATQLDNLAGDVTLFQSAMEGAQIVIADKLNPGLRDFVQFGTRGVSQLTEAFQSGGLTGAMGALGGVLSEGLNMVIAKVPEAMNAGMQLLGALGQGLLDNLPAITGAAVEIVTMLADGMLQAAPALMQGGIQVIGQLLTGIWNAAPTLVTGAAQLIQQIADTITTNVPLIADGLLAGLPQFVSMAGELLGALGEALLQNLPVLAAAAVTLMTGLGTYLKENLPSIIESGLTFVTALTESIRENAGLMVDGAISLAISLAEGLANSLPTIIQNIPQIVSNIANVINDNAPKLITAALNIIIALGKGLVDAIPVLIANIPAILKAIVDALMAFNWLNLGSSILKGIGSGMKGALSFLKNIGAQILSAVKGFAGNLPGIILAALAALPGLLGKLFGGAWSGVEDIFSPVGDFFSGIFAGAWQGIQDIWSAVAVWFDSTVVQPIAGFFSGLAESVSGFFSGLWKGIQDTWTAAATWFDTTVIQPLVGFFAPIVERVSAFFEGCWILIQAVWKLAATWFQDTVIQPTIDFFAPIIETVGGFFTDLWNGIQAVWAAVSGWFDTTVIQPTIGFFSAIPGAVGGFFSSLWSTVQGIWAAVASWFDTTVIQPTIGFFSGIVESIGGFFSTLWNDICAVWQAAGSWFETNVATPIKNAFQAVSDFVRGIFNGLIGFVEGMINSVIGAINSFIGGFNGLVGKAASFIGVDFGGVTEIKTVSLPRLAEGGIATGPTIAQIGEGGEPEAVVPLSKLASMIAGFMGAIPQAAKAPELQTSVTRTDILRQLPALATGGIATAPTLAQIGEGAEPEAILPLSKLAGMLKGLVGSSTTTITGGATSYLGGSTITGNTTSSITRNLVKQSQVQNAIAPVLQAIPGQLASLPEHTTGGTITILPMASPAATYTGNSTNVNTSAIGDTTSTLNRSITNISSLLQGGSSTTTAVTNQWRNYAGIPALAEGGIATEPTIAQVGEAGNEAIIPLGDLWGQLQGIVAETMTGATDRISTLAEQLDLADTRQGPEAFSIADLLGNLTGDGGESDNSDLQPIQVNYSPVNHYHFEGGTPDRTDIAAAEADDQERFFRYIRQYEKERARSNFRG